MTARTAAEPGRELVSRAYERLRELIVQGQLGPGVRLVEAELAERLGMSRTPLRMALFRLTQEGYVDAMGEGRQTRLAVAPLRQDDALEIFAIVGEVEGLAARRAAALASAPRAALVRKLSELNTAMQAAAGDIPINAVETIRLDAEFHGTYVEAGAGPRLLALFRTLKPQASRYIYLYYTTLIGEIMVSTAEHDVIIAAIATGNSTAARRAVRDNWENAAVRLSKSIATIGERGVW